MCSAVLRRMARIGWRSIGPHFEKSGSDRPPAAARAAGRRADVMTCLPCARTSSAEMRPPGPEPLHVVDVEPELRAPGGGPTAPPARADACRDRGGAGAAAAAAGRAPREKSTSSAGPLPFGLASPVLPPKLGARRAPARPAAAAGAAAGAWPAPAAAARRADPARTITAWPIVTLSPALTLISVTVPATDDGTSMVALSVSSSRTP